jgi:hypothetical protein
VEDKTSWLDAVELLLQLQQNIELREQLTTIVVRLCALDGLLKERLRQADVGHIHPP